MLLRVADFATEALLTERVIFVPVERRALTVLPSFVTDVVVRREPLTDPLEPLTVRPTVVLETFEPVVVRLP